MSKEPSKTSDGEGKGEASSTSSAENSQKPPALVGKLAGIDHAIGLVEHGFVGLSLFALIGVGTYQFLASRLFGVNDTWPFEALRYLVFFCAMGGAALSARNGRMICMDFLARKLAPKKRVTLRILVAGFVVFACYLLYTGGMFVREAARNEPYEVIDPAIALMALPLGAALIGVHYILHAVSDAAYLAAGQLPPEADGPQAH